MTTTEQRKSSSTTSNCNKSSLQDNIVIFTYDYDNDDTSDVIAVDDNHVNWITDGTLTIDNSSYTTITIPEPITADDFHAVRERIKRLEDLVGITARDRKLEKQYPDLQEIGDRMDKAINDLSKSYAQTISKIADAYTDHARQCEVMEKLKSDNG